MLQRIVPVTWPTKTLIDCVTGNACNTYTDIVTHGHVAKAPSCCSEQATGASDPIVAILRSTSVGLQLWVCQWWGLVPQ